MIFVTGPQPSFDVAAVAEKAASLRKQRRRIVQCHGVFDLLHPGHLEHLREASEQGDVLVVTITPDRFVNKGPGRPVYSQEQRAMMLKSLAIVDYVAITASPTAVEAIELIRPDVFVKGPDYANAEEDVSGNIVGEIEAVSALGGRVFITSAPSMSSSSIINAHVEQLDTASGQWLGDFRKAQSLDYVLGWVDRLSELRVLVVGEAIVDEYVRCEALGKSSKDPVLAFRELSREQHMGGSLAVAAHCAGLGADVTALVRLGASNDEYNGVVEDLARVLDLQVVESDVEPTIVKRRYIDDLTEARVFETYIMRDEPADDSDDERFRERLRELVSQVDLVVVADYGHGLVTQGVIADLAASSALLAVNTQSNAGNRGFNTISRYERVDLVCLNGSEVGLELRRRHESLDDLLPRLRQQVGASRAIVTDGARGIACCDQSDEVQHMPAFARVIRDRVGAGDALFAASALLFACGAPARISGFWGNLAGAAAVAEFGNRTSIEAKNLKRHAMALLK